MARPVWNVFINCPFDQSYTPSFRALVFAILACGFNVRCALETDDSSETRIDKLYRIIEECRFGIHDLSRTDLDSNSGLPRFSMPLELGIFLGSKRFGNESQRAKKCLVMDVERYRFQKFVSDLAGMDIQAHGGDPRKLVGRTRDWLVAVTRRRTIPSTAGILEGYDSFAVALPTLARSVGLAVDDIGYPDLERLTLGWLRQSPIAAPSQ